MSQDKSTTKKATQKPAKFTDEEKAAMKEHAKELKAEGESHVLVKKAMG